MSELVALHTQRLVPPVADVYLDRLARALRAARLNNTFPDRRKLTATLRALGSEMHHGLYDEVYVDARSGLPNMASFTRVLTDAQVGAQALERMGDHEEIEARRNEADVFERLARKRRYYEALAGLDAAPVDEHRVLLRRHDPAASKAMFRVELTKLAGSGTYVRVTIELTQVASVWSHKLVDLDERGEVASGTDALRSLVYRFATYDAETLFIRLHDLDGVLVERVHRGEVGPALFRIPADAGSPAVTLEPDDGALCRAWQRWSATSDATEPEMIVSFATDIAATDVREERTNDPLRSLLASGIRESEQARYRVLRERHPFRVFKDRKFVATRGVRPVVEGVCSAAGTRNLIYDLR